MKNPAKYVVDRFGGVVKAARAIGRDKGTISHWVSARRIPIRAWADVMLAGRKLRPRLRGRQILSFRD